jgi:hypothetical protein
MVVMVDEEVKPMDITAIEAVMAADTEREALLKMQEDELKKENSDVKIM